jgi:hypothetical protein
MNTSHNYNPIKQYGIQSIIWGLMILGILMSTSLPSASAVVMPSNTPSGSTPGWLFAQYFQNLSSPCLVNHFVTNISITGIKTCTPYSQLIDQISGINIPNSLFGDTLYYNGTRWVRSQNLFNDWTNIWINNPSPSEALDVIGNVRVSGNVRVGGNLTGATSISTKELCLNGTCVTSLGTSKVEYFAAWMDLCPVPNGSNCWWFETYDRTTNILPQSWLYIAWAWLSNVGIWWGPTKTIDRVQILVTGRENGDWPWTEWNFWPWYPYWLDTEHYVWNSGNGNHMWFTVRSNWEFRYRALDYSPGKGGVNLRITVWYSEIK